MKTLIAPVAANRGDFVRPQFELFKKFMVDPFEYVVFNNSADDRRPEDILRACDEAGCRCVRVSDRNHRTVNEAHAQAINWLYKNYILGEFRNFDYFLSIDFDMFLMDKFSVDEFMKGFNIAGVAQARQHVRYWWPGVLFLDLKSPALQEINFFCGLVDGIGVDTGGQLARYVREHPEVKVKEFFHTCGIASKKHWGEFFKGDLADRYDPAFGYEIYANRFLHHGRGGNWDNSPADYMAKKRDFLLEIVARRLRDEDVLLPNPIP